MRRTAALQLLLAAGLALGIASRAGAQIDQSQELFDSGRAINGFGTAWQTFTPSADGLLLGVDLLLSTFCVMPGCIPTPDLTVEIVAVSGGVPTAAVIGSTTVAGSATPLPATFVNVDLSSLGVFLTGGQTYAIHLASTGSGGPVEMSWTWMVQASTDPYPGGELFDDVDNSNGLDDPSTAIAPGSDAAFRTYMEPGSCGDGNPNTWEECDDGNTANGDGCSAICVDELCGDGIVNDASETCDDGGVTDGDGCSASCTLEKSGLACQTAIVKSGQKYVKAHLAALAKCRLAFAAGKTLSIANPRDCAEETAAASAIAKAGAALRKAVASGNKPKCTDALVAALGACAETVDDLVTSDASAGCLLATHDAAVRAIIEGQLGE